MIKAESKFFDNTEKLARLLKSALSSGSATLSTFPVLMAGGKIAETRKTETSKRKTFIGYRLKF
ncbi:MAG: hypothetical protein ACTS8P_04970 [Arsenophonus sp. NC-XBC3-MAG3]